MTSSFSKTFKLYKEENAEGTENQSLLGKGSRAPPAQHYSFDLTVGMDPELAAILEEESRHNFKGAGCGAWSLGYRSRLRDVERGGARTRASFIVEVWDFMFFGWYHFPL